MAEIIGLVQPLLIFNKHWLQTPGKAAMENKTGYLTSPQSTSFNDDKQLILLGSVRNKNFPTNISLAEA